MNHRIFSYNILSSHLSDPEYYTACDPANLDPDTRLARTIAKLDLETQQKSIVCLQEVSISWAGKLHKFFADRNYYFVTGQYGNPFNNYMGVGIAWPLDKYETIDIDITRLSDTRKWAKKPQIEKIKEDITKFFVTQLKLDKRKYADPLKESKRRYNQIVFLRLKDKNEDNKFCVATYHMPCAFYAPQVMTIHTAMAVQWVQKLAKEDAYILSGDFNIKPGDPQYQLITTGSIDPASIAYPEAKWGDTWQPSLSEPLRSAYAEAFGQEPDFTNYAKVGNKNPFIHTLDYIWLSGAWKVKSAMELPDRSEVKGPFPNEVEPSDHVAIAADLVLK